MKKLLGCLITLFLFSGLIAQEAAVSLSSNPIKIGEQTTFEWALKLPAAIEDYQYPSFKDSLAKGIEIISQSKVDTTFEEGDRPDRIIFQSITITAWDSGYYPIEPLSFIIDGKEMESKALLLEVHGIALEQEADIKDIKDIFSVPFSLWDWILSNKGSIGAILLILFLAWLAYFYYKKQKNRPKEDVKIVVPKEAADKVALRKLEALKKAQLWQQNQVKEYYVQLSFILREYIGNRYEVQALELTTDEIMLMTNKYLDISDTYKKDLQQTLIIADMAKFARQKPPAEENERVFKHTLDFIKGTALKEEKREEVNSSTKEEAKE